MECSIFELGVEVKLSFFCFGTGTGARRGIWAMGYLYGKIPQDTWSQDGMVVVAIAEDDDNDDDDDDDDVVRKYESVE